MQECHVRISPSKPLPSKKRRKAFLHRPLAGSLGRFASALACCAAIAAGTARSDAAIFYWDSDATAPNGVTDGAGTWASQGSVTFFNKLNSQEVPMGTADTAIFGDGGAGGIVNIGGPVTVGTLEFGITNGLGYTLSSTAAQTLTIGSGGIQMDAGAQAATVGNATLAIALGAAQSFTNNSSNLLTVAGVISGAVGSDLTVKGTGAGGIIFTRANTYAGTTSVESGTLIAGNAGAFGTATTDIALGTATSINSNLSPTLLTGGPLTLGRNITVGNNNGATSGIYTIGGNTASASAFSGIVTLNQSLNVTQVAGGTVSLTGNINSNGAVRTLRFNNLGSVVQNTGVIGSAGAQISIIQAGTGTTTLQGTNIYTGGNTISAGTLSIGVPVNLGAGASNVVFDGGTLRITGTSIPNLTGGLGHVVVFNPTKTVSLEISSAGFVVDGNVIFNQTTGGLTKLGAGTLVLSQSNSYTGTTTISAGTLGITTPANLGIGGALVFDGGTLQILGTTLMSITGLGHAVTFTPGKTVGFDIADNTNIFTVNQTLNQTTGGLTKLGLGTLLLNSAHAYTGTTTVSLGTLLYGANDVIATGPVTVTGGVFDISTFSDTVGAVTITGGLIDGTTGVLTGTSYSLQNGTVAAILAGPGAATKTTAGTVALSGANTYTGGTTISAGTLSVSASNNLGAPSSNLVFDGGILQITGLVLTNFSSLGRAVLFNSGKTVGLDISAAGNTFTADRVLNQGTGGFTKLGPGTVVLGSPTVTNTYTGPTTVTQGTLRAGVASVANLSGALGNNSAVVMANAVATLDLNGFSTQIGSLTGGGTGAANLGNIILGSATLTVGGNNTSPAAYIGIISGSGGLVKIGTGTLIIGGANTYTGPTSVLGGTLVLDHDSSDTAKLSPTAVLTLGNGTLQLDGVSNTFQNMTGEFVLSTTLIGAANITRPDITKPSAVVLHLGAITRNSGGSVNFSADNIATTNTLNDATGILGFWATVNGTDFAVNSTNSADGLIIALAGASYTDVTRLSSGAKTIVSNAASNVRIIEGTGTVGNITLGSNPTTINTLNQTSTGGLATIDMAGQTLATNAILMSTGSGALTIGTTVGNGTLKTATSGGDLALQSFSGNTLTINSVIANNTSASSLTQSGTGTVVLAANSTYSGATTIAGGELDLNGSLTGGTAINVSGTAIFSQSASSVISGAASYTQSSSGLSRLLGVNTFTGKTMINGGTIVIGAETGLGLNPASFTADQFTLNGGTLLTTANFSIDDINRGITLGAAGGTFGTTIGGTLTVASTNVITGPGGLTLTGSGALVLAGANTYNGATVINGGSLIISTAGSLGTATSKILVNGSANRYAGGGSLVLAGDFASGIVLSRDIDIMGLGPIADRGAALISVRNNMLSGVISRSTVNTFNTQVYSAGGLLQFTGTLNLTGTALSQFITLGGVNAVGVGNFALTGPSSALTGTGSLQKTSAGTFILDPTDSSGFSGTIRLSGGGTIRIVRAGVLGTRTGPLAANIGVNSVLDMNGGTLEIRMDAPSVNAGGSPALIYGRASSTFFIDHSLAGSALNGIATFGTLTMQGGQTYTLNGRDGYGVTFADTPINGGNSAAFTNNLNGLLTLDGGVWNNSDATARTLTFQGNGDTLVTGYITAAGADHFLTKTGSGVLRLTGSNPGTDTSSTFRGATSINGGTLAVTNITNVLNQGTTATNGSNNAINIGSGTTVGALSYLGGNATGIGETTPSVINLAGTTAAGIILANQAGVSASALILSSSVAASGAGAKNLVLGGTATGTIINQIQGVIQDNASANKTSIIKAGGSTWLYAPAGASFGAGSVTATGTTLGAANSNTISVVNPAGITVGEVVKAGGTNVPVGAVVTNVLGNNITLSSNIGTTIASGTSVTFGAATNFTGNVTIVGGTFQVRPTAISGNGSAPLSAVNGISFIADSATFGNQWAGGTFEYANTALAGVTLNLGPLTSSAGANTVKVDAPLSGTNGVIFSALVNPPAGTGLNIVSPANTSVTITSPSVNTTASTTTTTVVLTSTAGLVVGEVVTGTNIPAGDTIASITNATTLVLVTAPTALVPSNTPLKFGAQNLNGIINAHMYFNGADFAASPSGQIVAAGYLNFAGGSLATGNISPYNLTGDVTAQTNATINAGIRVSSGPRALTLGGGQTLTLRNGAPNIAGGILVTGGASQFTISGGTGITSGGTADIVFRTDTAGDSIVLNTPITSTTTGGFTKNGLGTLFLGAANAESGTVTINEGIVRLTGTGTLGVTNVGLTIRQGGTLDLNGVSVGTDVLGTNSINAFNGAGLVTNSSATPAFLRIGNNSTGGLFSGIIQDGIGKVSVVKAGSQLITLTGTNTYTGSTSIVGGTLTVTSLADIGVASGIGAGAVASNAASLVFNGGILQYTGANATFTQLTQTPSVSTNRLFTLAGNGTIDSSGQYGSPVLGGSGANSAALIFSNAGNIAFSGAGVRTLTLQGSSTGDNVMGLALGDNAGSALSLTKSGGGLWILGNTNTYTGTTTIGGGTLRAVNGASLPTASNFVINGGVLESTGTFTRGLGSGAGNMNLVNGGFAAASSKLIVNLTGGTPTWNTTPNFVINSLILSSATALAEVDIQSGFAISSGTANGMNLTTTAGSTTVNLVSGTTVGLAVGQTLTGNGNIPVTSTIASIISATQFTLNTGTGVTAATAIPTTAAGTGYREIIVNDNPNTATDFATISGSISGSGILRKSGGGVLQLLGASIYTGQTQVTTGILVVNTLGLTGGVSSSVGLPSASASRGITLGNGNTGAATLQYVGAGETSDRNISLFTTTGSDQIHADGSGPLILTNVTNDLAGAKTLFLRGSNAQANQITSNLSDNAGTALGVTVDGGATWVLAGQSTYTGTTTINVGVLGVGSNSTLTGSTLTSGPLGVGTLALTGGIFFANGADRSIANSIIGGTFTFIGDYSLALTGTYTSGGGMTTTNNIGQNGLLSGKFLSLGNVTFTAPVPTGNWLINGTGNTVVTGTIKNSTGNLNLFFNPATPTNTLTLFGASTYTGATILQNGRTILAGGSDNHLPSTTALTLGNGTNVAVLQLGDASGPSNLTVTSPYTLAPTPQNGPVVTIAGSGQNNAIVGGSTTPSAFAVYVNAVDPGTGTVLPDATLATVTPGALLLGSSSVNGPVGNEAKLRFVKIGPGTLRVDGTRYYTGGTDVGTFNGIDGGTLKLTASNFLGDNSSASVLNVYGGTVDTGGTTQFVSNLNLGGGAAGTFANVKITSGNLTIKGDITYNPANNPNTATISGAGSLDFKPSAPFTPNTFTTITVGSSAAGSGIGAADLTISSAIALGTNDLHKEGAGTLKLVPNSGTQWNGSVVLNGGTLILDGTAAANVGNYTILAPASTFTVNSGTKLNLGATEGDVVRLGQLVVHSSVASPSTLLFNLGAPNPTDPGNPNNNTTVVISNPASATSDLIDLSGGALILDGTTNLGKKVEINKISAGFGIGKYTLLTASSVTDNLGVAITPTSNTFALGTAPGGFGYLLVFHHPLDASNQPLTIWDLDLTVSVLPPGFFWKGGVDSKWSNSVGPNSNWVNAQTGGTAINGFPGIGNNVTFTADLRTNPNQITTTVDINLGVNLLTINDSTVATINGANGTVLTVNGLVGGIGLLINAGTVTIGGPANASPALDQRLFVGVLNSQSWRNNGAGPLTIVNQVFSAASSGTQTLTFDGSKDTIINGNIIDGGLGGTLKLLQASSGKLTLNNPANAYGGGTEIAAGTIAFAAGAIPSGGTVTFTGSGTLQWLGTPNTSDLSDRLKIGNGTTGTLDIVDIGNTVTFSNQVQAGPANLTTGTLNKTGAGTLIMAAPWVSGGYQRGTNITQGTLAFGAGAFYPYNTSVTTDANITFTGNSTLRWSTGNTDDVSDRLRIANGVTGTLDTNGNNITFSAATILDGGSSTGSLTKAGLGILRLTTTLKSDGTAGVAGYSGGTNIFDGTLEFVAGSLPPSGPVTFNNASPTSTATLRWITNPANPTNGTDLSARLNINNLAAAILDTNGNDVSFASQINSGAASVSTGSLTKAGAGTLTMNGVISGFGGYSGGTNIAAGTLEFAAGALPAVGAVTFTGSTTLRWLPGNTNDLSNRLTIPAGITGTVDIGGNNVTFASAMPASPGDLVKTGTGTLTFGPAANSNFTGGLNIDAGTVVVVGGGLSGTTGTKSVTVAQGATFALQGSSTDRVNNNATVTMGTGNSGVPANLQINQFNETMGVFSLAGNSVIDFAAAHSNTQLKFANSATASWTGALSIFNWTGNGVGGGADQLYFGLDSGGLTAGQLSAISFYSDSGVNFLGNATFVAAGEVVPVPEPAGLVALFSGAGCLLALRRRRPAR